MSVHNSHNMPQKMPPTRPSPVRKLTPQQLQAQSQFAPPAGPPSAPTTPPRTGDGGRLRRNSTSGGRPIPPRSELRNSPRNSPNAQGLSPVAQATEINAPAMPTRSERRNSPNPPISPLNTQTPQGAYELNGSEPVQPNTPLSPTTGRQTPNFSRPGAGAGNVPPVATAAPGMAAPSTAPVAHQSSRLGITGALKGLHGAGEALRGTVNTTIAKGLHDTAEEERMRAVRETGKSDWRSSGLAEKLESRPGERGSGGLREGFMEKAGLRIRRRSQEPGAIHGSEGPGGLQPVDER